VGILRTLCAPLEKRNGAKNMMSMQDGYSRLQPVHPTCILDNIVICIVIYIVHYAVITRIILYSSRINEMIKHGTILHANTSTLINSTGNFGSSRCMFICYMNGISRVIRILQIGKRFSFNKKKDIKHSFAF